MSTSGPIKNDDYSTLSGGLSFTYSNSSTISGLTTSFSDQTSGFKISNETSTRSKSDSTSLNIPELLEQLIEVREKQLLTDLNRTIDTKFKDTADQLTDLTESKQKEVKHLFEDEKKNLLQTISESEKSLQEVKNSVLATIAIFASFFTFISVSINIFSKANIIESIGLLMILWCCIFSFTYTFFLFAFNKWQNWKYWIPFVLTILFSIASLFWISSNNNTKNDVPTNKPQTNTNPESKNIEIDK